jgi:hypothetical protein
MKNTVKLFGNLTRAHSAKVPLVIIALVAVLGFSMAACDDDPGDPPDEYTSELKEVTTAGRLTITGLNVYNGKKIYAPNNFKVDATIPTLTARQTAYNRYNYKNGNLDWINIEDGMFGGTIAGGQVTLKVFYAQ